MSFQKQPLNSYIFLFSPLQYLKADALKRHSLEKLRIITLLEVSTIFLRRFRVLLLLNPEALHAVHLCYVCVVLAEYAIQRNHVNLKLKSKSFISLAEN